MSLINNYPSRRLLTEIEERKEKAIKGFDGSTNDTFRDDCIMNLVFLRAEVEDLIARLEAESRSLETWALRLEKIKEFDR